MPDRARLIQGRTILFGLLVLVLLSILLFFSPVVKCPICEISFAVERGEDPPGAHPFYGLRPGCDYCWRGWISPYYRWFAPGSPFPGSRTTPDE
jgi:hypothetical protein